MWPKQSNCLAKSQPDQAQRKPTMCIYAITTQLCVLPYGLQSRRLPLPEPELQHLFKGRGKQKPTRSFSLWHAAKASHVTQRTYGWAICIQNIPAQVTDKSFFSTDRQLEETFEQQQFQAFCKHVYRAGTVSGLV